jgi:hypothetical protein
MACPPAARAAERAAVPAAAATIARVPRAVGAAHPLLTVVLCGFGRGSTKGGRGTRTLRCKCVYRRLRGRDWCGLLRPHSAARPRLGLVLHQRNVSFRDVRGRDGGCSCGSGHDSFAPSSASGSVRANVSACSGSPITVLPRGPVLPWRCWLRRPRRSACRSSPDLHVIAPDQDQSASRVDSGVSMTPKRGSRPARCDLFVRC